MKVIEEQANAVMFLSQLLNGSNLEDSTVEKLNDLLRTAVEDTFESGESEKIVTLN